MSIALLFSVLTVLALVIPQMNVPLGPFPLALLFAILTTIFIALGR